MSTFRFLRVWAHDVRGVAASLALVWDVALSDFLPAACWRTSSVLVSRSFWGIAVMFGGLIGCGPPCGSWFGVRACVCGVGCRLGSCRCVPQDARSAVFVGCPLSVLCACRVRVVCLSDVGVPV